MKSVFNNIFVSSSMVMDTIENKPTFNHPNGIETVEINKPYFKPGFDNSPYSEFYIVDTDTQMRPDLVSLYTTQTEKNMDALLRFNEYPNPFSIDIGDVFLIPNMTDVRGATFSKTTDRSQNKQDIVDAVKAQYDTEYRKGKEVKNTIEDFKNKYKDIEKNAKNLEDYRNLANNASNPTKDLLPPNFSDDGKKELKILPNGQVIPGESVAKPKNGCEVNLSKAELISKLVKSRIKRV